MRQIVLDTETTGLEIAQGHRIIEIGCVELLHRRPTDNNFHQFVNPNREIDSGALDVHGIDAASLKDKPTFAQIAKDFLAFVEGTELIIHNAPFDVEFINFELKQLDIGITAIESLCSIVDTLVLARKMHPGQKNSLDALCKRYGIDDSHREYHGALLDARLLTDVYLRMTGGQVDLSLDDSVQGNKGPLQSSMYNVSSINNKNPIPVVYATAEELAAHEKFMKKINQARSG